MSHMSWTSRWRLCGASFMAKIGEPGTSPWTCLNISRTSLFARHLRDGKPPYLKLPGWTNQSASNLQQVQVRKLPPCRRMVPSAEVRCAHLSSAGFPSPMGVKAAPSRDSNIPPMQMSEQAHTIWLYLSYALAAAAPRRFEHYRVPNAGAAGERLIQAVYARGVVGVGRDDAVALVEGDGDAGAGPR